jgi:hypothetical protein
LDFRHIHVYSNAGLDVKAVVKEITKIFPRCKVDVKRPFKYDDRVELARISDLKQPFERQPEQHAGVMTLYDGFVLQRIFEEMILASEADHVHIIFTGLLMCTFSEEDWRYHGRAVICGTPSIVSTSGIVEAPAKPREFYLAQFAGVEDPTLKKQFAGRFLDYGDDRITDAAAIYALQALFFFVTGGEPFCDDRSCSLYNPHWQEELVQMIEKGKLCSRHRETANKFNKEFAKRRSFQRRRPAA